MRKTVFANDEYYHVYNRGVDKREVFLNEGDYVRFLTYLREFNDNSTYEQRIFLKNQKNIKSSSKELSSCIQELSSLEESQPSVEIIAYCLSPNHYHLILKQLVENGVKIFMHKLGTGYTNYFNKKYQRSGSLFQGPFKAIHIDSNEYLLLLSAYVNRNYFIHGYQGEDLGTKSPSGGSVPTPMQDEWKYCSALEYLGKRNGTLCKKEIVLNQFGQLGSESRASYAEFLDVNANYFRDKKELQKYILE
ncbi:MAG: transposase [Candidatus Moraniibacteriota bacterium]